MIEMLIIRRVSAVVAGIALVSCISGCAPTRSVEAYCAVKEKHKERFETPANRANSNPDLLFGSLQMASVIGDLALMFEEAAEVAPQDIASDVEKTAKYFAQQEDMAREMLKDPLAGFMHAFGDGIMSSGSLMRVDEYTAKNCPAVGRMF